jgi:hypothetical protein
MARNVVAVAAGWALLMLLLGQVGSKRNHVLYQALTGIRHVHVPAPHGPLMYRLPGAPGKFPLGTSSVCSASNLSHTK